MKNIFKTIGVVTLIIALIIGAICLQAWVFMLLANWVLGLFKVAFTFSFIQSVGVTMLLDFIGGFFKKNSSSK